jgi:hypothetical protein
MASITAAGWTGRSLSSYQNAEDRMNSQSYTPHLRSTLQEAGLWRIYKSTDAYDAAYTHDCEWFAAHVRPKRRLSVRARIGKEFEAFQLPRSGNVASPTLWLCVIEVSLGFHVALPIWSGDAFFRTQTFKYAAVADVRCDSEIAVLLDECSRRVSGSIAQLYGKTDHQ